MAAVRIVSSALAVLALATAVGGCKTYSRNDPPAPAPEGYPLERPLFEKVEWSSRSDQHDLVKTAMLAEIEASGAVAAGAGTGYTLRLRTRSQPESMHIAIDVLNILTAGLVPKIRDYRLFLRGSYVKDDQELLSEQLEGSVGSFELWLPLIFWPPAYPFVNKGDGSPEFVDTYTELTQQVLVALAAKLGEVPEPTPPETATTPTVTSTPTPTEQLPECPICGEPRGRDQNPCPHCGMD
jgi:hypothetical protein